MTSTLQRLERDVLAVKAVVKGLIDAQSLCDPGPSWGPEVGKTDRHQAPLEPPGEGF